MNCTSFQCINTINKQETHKVLTTTICLVNVQYICRNQTRIMTGIAKTRRFRKLIKVMVLCLWSWKRIEAAVGTERQWGYSTLLLNPYTHRPPTPPWGIILFLSSHIFPFFSFVLSPLQRYVLKWDFNYTIEWMRAQDQREMGLRCLLTTIQ